MNVAACLMLAALDLAESCFSPFSVKRALTGLEEQLDVHIIHYDAYVLEPSDNLDRSVYSQANQSGASRG